MQPQNQQENATPLNIKFSFFRFNRFRLKLLELLLDSFFNLFIVPTIGNGEKLRSRVVNFFCVLHAKSDTTSCCRDSLEILRLNLILSE